MSLHEISAQISGFANCAYEDEWVESHPAMDLLCPENKQDAMHFRILQTALGPQEFSVLPLNQLEFRRPNILECATQLFCTL